MVYKDNSKTYQKRLPTSTNYAKGIVNYDVDNLYPQRVDSIVRRSPIALSCIETISDFLNGDGFALNWEEVYNAACEKAYIEKQILILLVVCFHNK